MDISKQLGSAAALALASDPLSSPTTIFTAGVAVIISAALFAYKEYEDYEENKHKSEIEAINKLHEKYLAKIIIHDSAEIRGFPPIFKFGTGDKINTVEFMELTSEDVLDISKTNYASNDERLAYYQKCIFNAVLKLQDYYFSDEKKKRITANVICYLLDMLQAKCLNFQGYDYDIAYLSALIHFINAYSSMKKTTKTRHFSRLNEVYKYLLSAKLSLEHHQQLLSLNDTVNSLKDFCLLQNDTLLRYLALMFVAKKDEVYVATVTIDELKDHILRKKYIRCEINGLPTSHDEQIEVPNCIFRKWLEILANYYLQTLNIDRNCVEKDIVLSADIFADHKSSHIRLIRDAFKGAENFISSKVEDDILVKVSEDAEIIERTKIVYQFCHLIHQIISLQYLSLQLLRSSKQLGDIYLQNPKHFQKVFILLEDLCQAILISTKQNEQNLVMIQNKNGNNMQLDSFQEFPEKIAEALNTVVVRVSTLSKRILNHRKKSAELQAGEAMTKKANEQITETTSLISNLYQLKLSFDEEEKKYEPTRAEM